MVFFIPPFQKPDEVVHYHRSVSLAKGDFLCGSSQRLFNVDSKYLSIVEELGTSRIAFHYDEKFKLSQITTDSYGFTNENGTLASQCHLPFPSYLLFIVGIIFGELFNNIIIGFYLCRFLAFLFFVISILISLRILKNSNFRWIILFYSVIPMVLHQISAIGYDYLQLSLAPILFSLNIKFFKEKYSIKEVVAYGIAILLFVLIKPGYYAIPFLMLLIPSTNFLGTNKKLWVYKIISLLISFLIIIVSLEIFANQDGIVNNGVIYDKISPLINLGYTTDLITNTLNLFKRFYLESFWGYFGWLDYSLPLSLYIIATGLFIAFGVRLSHNKIFEKLNKWYFLNLLIVLLVSFTLIFFSLYLTNEKGTTIIYGVQGRYFLIFFPYLLFLFAFSLNYINKIKNRKFLFLVFISLFIVFVIIRAIYLRYYSHISFQDITEFIVNLL